MFRCDPDGPTAKPEEPKADAKAEEPKGQKDAPAQK
jgi:hypothetical protein